jgi:hypothetical protein
LGDARGRRNMLLVALSVFVLGSLACGLAQSLPQLVAARVLQGLGGGGLMTLSQAIIGELVPPVERVRFQGYFALVFTTASIGGPVVGGLIVSHVSWRWLFFANLPFAAFAAWRLCKLPAGDRHPPLAGPVDVAGHVLFAVGALSTLFWLTSAGHRFAWGSMTSAALGRHGGSVPDCAVLARAPAQRSLSSRRSAAAENHRAFRRARAALCLVPLRHGVLSAHLPAAGSPGQRRSGGPAAPAVDRRTGHLRRLTSSRILRRTGEPHPIPVIGMSITSAGLLLLGLLPPHMSFVIVLGFVTGLRARHRHAREPGRGADRWQAVRAWGR